MKRIKVSLVEDNRLLATELEKYIRSTPEFLFGGNYPSAEEALEVVSGTPPDVLLVDLRLPGMSGVDLIRTLKQKGVEVQCLVLTMYAESDLIFEALRAGACGYLLKRMTPAEITEAIKQVSAGGSVMTPRIARRVLEMFTSAVTVAVDNTESGHLNVREKQVLQCMAEGMVRKQIAERTKLNTHTLDYVIRCIYKKLHVNCPAAAVSVGVRFGILYPPNKPA